MSCHQTGHTRVPSPGKDILDFRPGQPLSETLVIAKLTAQPGDEDLLEHHSAMRDSVCFCRRAMASSAASHVMIRTGEERCGRRSVVSREVPGLPHDNGAVPAPSESAGMERLQGLHMPARTSTISHSALTNHRIVRQPGVVSKSTPYKQDGPVEFVNVSDSHWHPRQSRCSDLWRAP